MDQDISILELLEHDFRQKADTVYQETVILSQRITADDLSHKNAIDDLLLEVADPFFYGSVVTSIGKTYYFLPVKVKENAYLLKEVKAQEAKFMVRLHRTTLDIEIRSFSDWRLVKEGEPVSYPRYVGMNKKRHAEGKSQLLCFIIIDFINKTRPQ